MPNNQAASSVWEKPRGTLTAEKDLAKILGVTRNLPVRFWESRFFFVGARDADLFALSAGMFPVTTQPGKTHPVISLKPLPDKVGFKVSPCSSKRPWYLKEAYFIKKGCRLKHTDWEMDRNSYVVEHIEVPIPASIAINLVFKGQVPFECIKKEG